MRTRESEEMYLETILILQEKKKNVRSIDVVEEINYAKSSVSRAVNLLEKKGYIRFDEFGYIYRRGEETRRRCVRKTQRSDRFFSENRRDTRIGGI